MSAVTHVAGPPRPTTPGLAPHGSTPTLEQLLRQSAGGDDGAFAAFYDRCSTRVYGLILRILRDPHQAEEVTQEVFLDIWRHAPRFDPTSGCAINWALMKARSKAVDRVRASDATRHRDTTFHWANHHTPFDSTSDHVHGQDTARALHDALTLLSPVQRTALELFYLHDMSQQEIATHTHQPLGTTKGRLRQGLRRLQHLHRDGTLSGLSR